MQASFEKIEFLIGTQSMLQTIDQVSALQVFSTSMMEYLSALSNRLLRNTRTREYPDLSSFAFWIRKASLERMKNERKHLEKKIGRGVSFHIAPSNVPMAFGMSAVSALLAGNAAIVRVSQKTFPQSEILIEEMAHLLNNEFSDLSAYLCIVRYPHDPELTQALSDCCDARLIWGGDTTIQTVRQATLPPRAIELTFANRHSLAVIDADAYLKEDVAAVAERFYLDTYYTDQNACSSPRLIVWLGTKVEVAREFFWNSTLALAQQRYDMQPIQAIDKYTAFCRFATVATIKLQPSNDNVLMRVLLPHLSSKSMEYKEGGGYFFEYIAKDIQEILPVCGKSCQTIACLGISPAELRKLIVSKGIRGVDRIVPMGDTNKLTLRWDGYDLVDALSRYVSLGDEE